MTGSENCIKRLKEIDADAKKKGEYSLGDVLLQERFEKQLTENCGYTKEEVKQFSPFYYEE